MAQAGRDGAAAAATYFMSLYPYVLATGDLAAWDAMSAPSCDFCNNTRSEVERLRAAGQRNLGGITVLAATGTDLGSNGWHSASLEVEIHRSSDVDEEGTVVASREGGTYSVDLALTWSGGWLVDSAGIVGTPRT